jgi:integrase
VDLQNGILAIRQTKFGKSRFVPVHDSTRKALLQYSERQNELYLQPKTDAFLISEKGKQLCNCVVRRTFARILCNIGLRAPAIKWRIGRGPRLQDIRHTFATRTLVAWYRAGKDVQRELPKLATYLGHVDIAHTYWYIEAVPELLGLATDYLRTHKQGGAQ